MLPDSEPHVVRLKSDQYLSRIQNTFTSRCIPVVYGFILFIVVSCGTKPQEGNDDAAVDSAGVASDSMIFSDDEV